MTKTATLVGLAAFFGAGLSTGCDSALGQSVAPPPAVEFDHSIHAGQYQIACLFCHSAATRSPVAGVSSAARCMGCHKLTAVDRPAIQSLAALYAAGQAPTWTKVYDLPDHVYFSHRVHLRAEVACAECHGKVETMKVVERVSPLTMGWCLSCHKTKNASNDCLACHK